MSVVYRLWVWLSQVVNGKMPAFLKSISVIILMNCAALALTAGALTRYA
jgi:hypothetical protein